MLINNLPLIVDNEFLIQTSMHGIYVARGFARNPYLPPNEDLSDPVLLSAIVKPESRMDGCLKINRISESQHLSRIVIWAIWGVDLEITAQV